MMFKRITFAFMLVVAMIGCDRVGDYGSENCDLISRSVLLANPDRFCVTMNYAGDKIAYLARKESETELEWKAEENFDTGIIKTIEWYLFKEKLI
jgi:dTDP-D-glucose 4,6-dehydratase